MISIAETVALSSPALVILLAAIIEQRSTLKWLKECETEQPPLSMINPAVFNVNTTGVVGPGKDGHVLDGCSLTQSGYTCGKVQKRKAPTLQK